MKKKVVTAVLLTFTSILLFTGCNNTPKEEKSTEPAKTAVEWEVNSYYMNGFYNPKTKELTTVDAAGNADAWDNIEILDLYKDAEYWQNVDENNEVFVWVKINTNNTKVISDDEAVVFPGNESVYKSHTHVYSIDGNIVMEAEK